MNTVSSVENTVPTPAQLAWQRDGFGIFIHFGVNTFADVEWSDGTIPASAFQPETVDPAGWVKVAAELGARYLVVGAKHHDGFCLWPTATTDYSVASSPWRDGRGDVVGDTAAACEQAGIGFGVYLSPWDRHAPEYNDPASYDDYYCRQLTELLTSYGPLYEIWFDGAGSENRSYDWPRIDDLCRTHQPDAMRFNMGDFTIRWIGNEDGLASDPVTYLTDAVPYSMLSPTTRDVVQRYAPPECDVSLRPGWFWHGDEEPKPLEQLLTIVQRSYGLGANLLLNLPIDRHGAVDPADRARCAELASVLDHWRGSRRAVPLRFDAHGRAILDLPELPADSVIELCEDLAGGQRVTEHRLFNHAGELIAAGHTIGVRRWHHISAAHTGPFVIETDGDAPVLAGAHVFDAGGHWAQTLPVGSSDGQ